MKERIWVCKICLDVDTQIAERFARQMSKVMGNNGNVNQEIRQP